MGFIYCQQVLITRFTSPFPQSLPFMANKPQQQQIRASIACVYNLLFDLTLRRKDRVDIWLSILFKGPKDASYQGHSQSDSKSRGPNNLTNQSWVLRKIRRIHRFNLSVKYYCMFKPFT